VDAEALVASFLRRLASLLAGGPEAIVDGWRLRSDTLGRPVEATTIAGTVVRGLARDVDATGALVVDAGDRTPVRVAFGDVRHLLVPEP
jgi:BirA family biotin operon repressor/biotin-[acetyl-CoA-carboxylase] ligase